jgi:hypothetical protein
MISSTRMESSRSNQKPLARERDLPKQVTLGRTLLVLAAALAVVLLVAPRTLAPISAIVVSAVAFPVLIELRTLSRGGAGVLEGEPWSIDAVCLLVTSVCLLGLGSVSPLAAWAFAWLVAGVLAALGRRASR